MRKYVIIATTAAVVVITAVLLINKYSKNKIDPDEKLYIVKRGLFEKIIETTGEVVANTEVNIKCKASGEIILLPVDISNEVKKGDLILKLDSENQETLVKQAKVSLAMAQAEFSQAKYNLELAENELRIKTAHIESLLKTSKQKKDETEKRFLRAKILMEKRLKSADDYQLIYLVYLASLDATETAQYDYDSLELSKIENKVKEQNVKIAESKVELTKLELDEALQNLKDITVLAPIDGVVSVKNVQIGQIIASGINNVDGGTTVMTLLDLSKIFVLASVDESDIGSIRNGQKAIIEADAYPNVTFEGKVVRIATAGVTVSNVVTFEVKLEVTSGNSRLLKPGMTVDIDIVAAKKNNAVIVPYSAVTQKSGKQYAVVKSPKGKYRERELVTGNSNGNEIEIIKGVKDGDILVLSGDSNSRWSSKDSSGKSRAARRLRMMPL